MSQTKMQHLQTRSLSKSIALKTKNPVALTPKLKYIQIKSEE